MINIEGVILGLNMNTYISDELNDAMNTMEVLINSEHQDLFLNVVNSFVKNKTVEKSTMTKASKAIRSVMYS